MSRKHRRSGTKKRRKARARRNDGPVKPPKNTLLLFEQHSWW